MKVVVDQYYPKAARRWIELCCYYHLSAILEVDVIEPGNLF
jgi:hypothetical protein